MANTWLNGSLVEDQQAAISLRDVGFLHGVGVFTTIRVSRGAPHHLSAHLKRIRNSCEHFSIPLAFTDDDFSSAIDSLVASAEIDDARLRLIITRGTTFNDPEKGIVIEPTVALTIDPSPVYPKDLYDRGMTVQVVDQQKLNPYDVQAGHKTMNYLSRFTALHNAIRAGAHEAIWFNVHNFLQSGSIANIFLVQGNHLLTPPTQIEMDEIEVKSATPYPTSNVIPGVTRALIIDEAIGRGIAVYRKALTISDLLEADEVFLTNSLMGVMPVCRIERKAIGNEKPGKLTLMIREAIEAER
ncbi:MAG TPA: aminotransferase class IV [Tepidisphaeraceae bacterium]|nr:aminotransferase class IV [Tepidisphaeraceae bacterium]